MPNCAYCGGTRIIRLDARYAGRVSAFESPPPDATVEHREFPCPACGGSGTNSAMRFETIGAAVRISVDAPDEYRRDALISGLKDRIAEAIARSITIDHRNIRQERYARDNVDEFRVEFRVGIAGVPFNPHDSVRHPVRHVAPPPPPLPRPPMEVAEQVVGLVLSALDRIYFKGWAVLKEDAQQIIREAMERVRSGNVAGVMTREQVQERLGEYVAERRADSGLTVEAINHAREMGRQAGLRDREWAAREFESDDLAQAMTRSADHEARQMAERMARQHAEAAERATMDAMVSGSGMVRMNGDGAMEYVPAEATATEMARLRLDHERRNANAEARRRLQMMAAAQAAPPEARSAVLRRVMETGGNWTVEELAELNRVATRRGE